MPVTDPLKSSWTNRAAAAWRALTSATPAVTAIDPADPRTTAATQALDLRDRDAQIASLRQEYQRLEQQARQDKDGAASASTETLLRRLAPLLSQLATMQAFAQAGRSLRIEDVLKLFAKVEQVLVESGLARIGTVGQACSFDSRQHQRLSGADVDEGSAVAVRFVGYSIGEQVLLKAMVGRQGMDRSAQDSTTDPK